MFYAERDQNGKIIAIRKDPEHAGVSLDAVDTEELLRFFEQGGKAEGRDSLLAYMDAGFIRVLDDLIEVLISKNIILLTDLPEEARQKLGVRQEVRKRIQQHFKLTDDDIL